MALTTMKSISSGAIFGAALTVAGVYSPSVIIGQMQLQDFHMLKSFLAASASSAIAIILGQKFNFTTCKPRTPASLGILGTYDGNIIGGLLLGCGMALTGACPGTVLPQLSTAIPSAPYVFLGCTIGGIVYAALKPHLPSSPSTALASDAFKKPAVYQKVGIEKRNAVVMYEGILIAVIVTASILFPEKGKVLVPPVVGGLFIGGAQAVSLVLTGNTLGVSTAYEQIGDLFWWGQGRLFGGKKNPRPNIKGMAFALGGLVGSWGVSRLVAIPAPNEVVKVGITRAVAGGLLLVIGSRLAGGCTSGHGISGMSQLSTSSFVTVAALFGAGIGLTILLG